MTSSNRISGWLKEVSWHSIVYGLGAVLQASLNFLLLPLYTGQFPADQFGVFQMVVAASAFAGALFYLGAYSSLSRFYFDAPDGAGKQRVAGAAVALTLGGAIMQVVVIVLCARPLSHALFETPAYATALIVGFGGSALTFVNQIFLLVLRLNRRSTAVVVANLAALVATGASVAWLVLVAHWGIMGALTGSVIGQAAILPVVALIAAPSIGWSGLVAEMRPQLAFGLPAVMIGLGYYALDQADRYVLAHRGTLTDVGVYSLGYRIGMVVQMLFVQPFAQIWNPMRLEYRNQPEAPRFFALVLTYYTLIGLTLVSALSLFAPEIIGIVGRRPEYAGAAAVVPIVLFSHLIYGAVNLLDTGILVNNRLRYYVGLLWMALMLNLALNLWLVPSFGYMGSAWATLASYTILVACVFAVSNRLLPVAAEPRRLALGGVSAIALIVAARFMDGAPLVTIAARAALFAGLLLSWWAWLLTGEERIWLRRGLARLGILGGRA